MNTTNLNPDIENNTSSQHGQYYSLLMDYDKLIQAYMKSKKGVDWKASIQWYMYDLGTNVIKLYNQLDNHTYKPRQFHEFELNERGKQRHIKAVSIYDRVLQRTMCDEVLVPILQEYLIYDNGASVKTKGLSFARERMKKQLHNYWINNNHSNEGYILLIDFSKYFDNINHEKLIRMVSEKIDDPEFMSLFAYIVSTFCVDGDNTKSLGIGSQISQISGIFYPHPIDNLCKIVLGLKNYGRYMDDSYAIARTKEELEELLRKIEVVCAEYDIIINKKKTQIVKLSHGFKWLQITYTLCEDGRILQFVNPKTLNREKRKLKRQYGKFLAEEITIEKIYNMYNSWEGEYIKYDSKEKIYKIRKKFYEYFGPYIEEYLQQKMIEDRKKYSKKELTSMMYT